MRATIEAGIRRHAQMMEALTNGHLDLLERAATLWVESLRAGGKLLFFGNGGSAALSQHLAAKLIGRLQVDRPGLPALALAANTSALTSIASEYAYDLVFARHVDALGRPGDVAIGFSTSGGAASVARALEVAEERGLRTVGFTGKRGGVCAQMAEVALKAPSDEPARVLELHLIWGHVLCEVVEEEVSKPPRVSLR